MSFGNWLYVNFSVKSLNFFQKRAAYFGGHFTIATVNVKLIPEFYTWAIVPIKQYEEIGKKQLLFLSIKQRWSLQTDYLWPINLLLYSDRACRMLTQTHYRRSLISAFVIRLCKVKYLNLQQAKLQFSS